MAATPTRSGATPTRSGATPTRSAATPTRSAATPTRSAATPTRSAATPTRSGATPTRSGATPTRSGATPTRSAATPTRSAATPTRSGATPTRSAATPTRSGATPTRSGATPTRSAATPTRSGATPTRSAATPTRSGATPTRSGATPTRSGAYYISHDRYMCHYVFKKGDNECVKKMLLPDCVDNDSAIACDGERVVIVGGWNSVRGNRHALLVDMRGDGHVRKLPNLPEPRFYTGVVLSGNDVYVFGGGNKYNYVLSSVYHLSLGSDAWQPRAPMPFGVSSPLVIRHKQYIYVLGGDSVDNDRKETALRYHIQNDTWEIRKGITKKPKSRRRKKMASITSNVAGVVIHRDQIKVFTVNKCLTHDVDNDRWSVDYNKSIGVKVNVFVTGGQIWGAVWRNCSRDYESHKMMRYVRSKRKWLIEQNRVIDAWRTKLFC